MSRVYEYSSHGEIFTGRAAPPRTSLPRRNAPASTCVEINRTTRKLKLPRDSDFPAGLSICNYPTLACFLDVCAVCPHCKEFQLTTEAGSDGKPDEIDEITAGKPDREFPLDCVWGCNFSACIYSICSGCDYCKEKNG